MILKAHRKNKLDRKKSNEEVLKTIKEKYTLMNVIRTRCWKMI